MVTLFGTLSRLKPGKILVAGDLILDTYTIGKARRISPEAPVAVLQVQSEESKAGGAGNAILNMISLGAETICLGRVGADDAGDFLKNALSEEGVGVNGIFTDSSFQTPVKNRIIAENQQMVRIDYEKVTALPSELEEKIIAKIPDLLNGVTAVAISDYGKGFLTKAILKTLIACANEKGILVIADPKGTDFSKYQGVYLIKPNLSEAYEAAGLGMNASLEEAAEKILEKCSAEYLMVTRGEAGISLFSKAGQRTDYPTQVREVKDVTGAGDTVLAMIACALASGLDSAQAIELSNIAAGMAIEHIGCARISLLELAKRLLEINVKNKIFDEEHFLAMKEVLGHQEYNILKVKGDEPFNEDFILRLCEMKEKERSLLVSIENANPSEAFVKMMAALHPVDFVILKNKTLT